MKKYWGTSGDSEKCKQAKNTTVNTTTWLVPMCTNAWILPVPSLPSSLYLMYCLSAAGATSGSA